MGEPMPPPRRGPPRSAGSRPPTPRHPAKPGKCSKSSPGPPVARHSASPRTSALAIWGFVLALLVAPAGLVVSTLGLRRIAGSRGALTGRGLALAGAILGGLFTVTGAISWTILLVVLPRSQENAERARAIAALHLLESACDSYRIVDGSFPGDAPGELARALTGPGPRGMGYMTGMEVVGESFVDLWGRPVRYRNNQGTPPRADAHLPGAIDLWCFGPNGVDEGGEGDDVANWGWDDHPWEAPDSGWTFP